MGGGDIPIQQLPDKIKILEHREESQINANECFIALIICSTCFRHLHAHHQELETIPVLLPHMVCNALVAGGRLLGAERQAMRPGGGLLGAEQQDMRLG